MEAIDEAWKGRIRDDATRAEAFAEWSMSETDPQAKQDFDRVFEIVSDVADDTALLAGGFTPCPR